MAISAPDTGARFTASDQAVVTYIPAGVGTTRLSRPVV